jgi:hypothetical protein
MLSNSNDSDFDSQANTSWRRAEKQPVKKLLDDKYLVFETIGDGRYAK